MKFLNSTPCFKLYKENESEFFYQGIFDRDIKTIFQTLEEGKIPYNLKGNFAYFFKNTRRVVFAVDHAASYNMHWTKDTVCPIFYHLRTDAEHPNPIVIRQRQMFFGSAQGSNETIVKEIKRLEPGTYFEKNLITGEEKIDYYIDLFRHKVDPAITLDDVSDIFETVIEEQTRDPFSLLWSSGTDSNCIYGFIRKLKRTENCTLVSLYSSFATSDEKPQIEELARTYGIKTNFLDVGKYQGVTQELKNMISDPNCDPIFKENYHRIWRGAMWEPSIFTKYKSMCDLNITDRPMLTGEPGDLIFGNNHTKNLLSTLLQRPETSVKECAQLFVCGDFTLQRKKQFRHLEGFYQFLRSSPVNYKAWMGSVDWIIKHFPDLRNSEDIINDLDAMYYQFKAQKLIYGYNQYTDVEFRHPFLDYRIFWIMNSIPGIWKMKNGKIRQISREIIKDHVDPRPWTEWPKSGLEILFRPAHRNVEL